MSEYKTPNEPSGDECNAGAKVFEDNERIGYACWYPQMGGYVGKAVVVLSKPVEESCFDVYIWHDGEFPFGDEDGRGPVVLHHCEAQQFIRFGEQVKKMMGVE